MQLSKRLQALADMVTPGNVLADVGCDHGYIPIYLIKNHRIPKAIAMDIGAGPLERARENIKVYGLTGYIETRLSDGLKELKPGEAETVIISGMGGPLMEQILREGLAVRESLRELILQPQSDIPHFRRFLTEQGYTICEENMVKEDGKYYPMMKAVKGENSYTPLEYRYGPHLLNGRHPVLLDYLQAEWKNKQQIVDHLAEQTGEGAKLRRKELQEELISVKEALNYYEM